MGQDFARFGAHPSGEQSPVEPDASGVGVVVDSFAGSIRVEFDHEAAFTPLGQLPFFIDFLKTAGLFEALVADCPLRYTSPNAPKKRDVLGTAMLSMLAGHKRYAHIAALRSDRVLPELLDMSKIVSEDAVRRAFAAIEEEAGANWLRGSSRPLRGAAFERAVDTRRRYDGEAALRPSGRSGGRLQSQEAWAAQPLLSHLFDGGDAIGSRCGCERGRRAHFPSQRAWAVGALGSNAARLLAFSFARRQGLRQ